ncbi:hypothetical protein B1748_04605 [Paenibacillus sp. MY03]|jgi:hypothetical protein|nr:hypothetical protein B1748_04605 [Paenibacillus sp. MY03]
MDIAWLDRVLARSADRHAKQASRQSSVVLDRLLMLESKSTGLALNKQVLGIKIKNYTREPWFRRGE